MSELPCVGAGITVVDPGPNTDGVFRKRKDGRPSAPRKPSRALRSLWHDVPLRLLKAFVVGPGGSPSDYVAWKCGIREGHVRLDREGADWVRGHGPQARGALIAQRALEQHR